MCKFGCFLSSVKEELKIKESVTTMWMMTQCRDGDHFTFDSATVYTGDINIG